MCWQDIKHLAYEGCRLTSLAEEVRDGPPLSTSSSPAPSSWRSLHTWDGSGSQRWSRGDKRTFLYFYSLVHHFDLRVQREGWRGWEGRGVEAEVERLRRWRCEDEEAERRGASPDLRIAAIAASASSCPPMGRPVVFLNVMNHLMAPYNANPLLPLHPHAAIPMFPGDRAVAETFGQLAVPCKWTLWSCIPSALYSPIPLRTRTQVREWRGTSHSALLRGGGAALDEASGGVQANKAEEEKGRDSSGGGNGTESGVQ